MKFDLHMHTTRHSPDGRQGPFDLVRRAREIGLDGVVITEHDWLWTEKELDELRAAEPKLVVLAGVEVSAYQGHFLAYGVRNPFAIPKGIHVADLCREMHRQGGVVVAAHPYRWGQDFDRILRKDRPELDGLELMTKNMDGDCRRRAADVFRTHTLTGLGSSDAHALHELGCCYTEFDADIHDVRGLVAAIRARKASARERVGNDE